MSLAGVVFALFWGWQALPAGPAPQASVSPRVAEEADVLEQNAPKILTTEHLEQRSVMPPSRFRPRAGSLAEQAIGPRFRIRQVASEFSFGALRNSPSHDLVEFRQVLSVDGEPVDTSENAVRSLTQAIQRGDDRARKRLLEEFARSGLVDIATDYALILLAFTARNQQRMEIAPLGRGYVGTDAAVSLAWKQKSAEGGVVEFHGQEAIHRALEGTLWLRAADGLPLRVTSWMEYTDQSQHRIREEASVDYQMSEHGFLTPASVVHRHLVNGAVATENLYRYEPFKLFSSSSTITFGSPDTTAIKK